MTDRKTKKYFLSWAGFLVPGFFYFVNIAPPLLPKGISLLSASAAFVLVVRPYQSVKSATSLIFLSIGLLIIYLILLHFCTVVDPQGKYRWQIGFGRCEWGLTKEALEYKQEYPTTIAKDWMLDFKAYRHGGPEVIWVPWTIYFSGGLMLLVYWVSFILWTMGWASID